MIPIHQQEDDVYLDCQKMWVGKTVSDISYRMSNGIKYIRYTFGDGGYQEWHTSLKHVTYHPPKSESD